MKHLLSIRDMAATWIDAFTQRLSPTMRCVNASGKIIDEFHNSGWKNSVGVDGHRVHQRER
jgi:hypothetical protein